ncbi:alpha-amylase family glycosyl hydrolase [Agarivorans aestuarii]|uniref:Alpha-amylase family glycosyl hydrolase n=1 Tax=Agarivorans aestuarii TaxID=1563703 RepID=A0ABU7G5R4_9ALTE|nr:alpha-amylase family glycosyl hydrolase [Agarivorans aestuarii]MEE1674742.1 alpha-amylase family glycosyl hydrolase [Agarivorans aestuarii]
MKKTALVISLLAASSAAQADWFYRGTSNGWATSALELVAGSEYRTCQSFADNDPRFKIDRFGDWNEAYPSADVRVDANKNYEIRFFSDSKNITTTEVATCGDIEPPEDSWFYRGTSNGWAATAMTSTDNVNFCTSQSFANDEPRFKIDHYGDWNEAYPTADYTVTGNASYQICFNASSKAITVTPDNVSDTQAPEVVATPAAGSYTEAQQISLSVSDNQDSAPLIYCTTDGSTPTADSSPCNDVSFTASDVVSDGVDLSLKVFAIDASGNSAVSSFDYTISDAPADTWYFRGTPNGWQTTLMTSSDGNNYCTTQSFGSNNPRFKIDHFGDWTENYPGADVLVDANSTYQICFNATTKAVNTVKQGCEPNCATETETLGAVYSPQSTTFSIWSPDHSNVKVLVDGVEHSLQAVPDFAGYTQVYQVTVEGDLHLKPYTFLINGVQVRDPYGKMAQPGTGDYEAINIVMDMSRTEPVGGWAARPALIEREDAVIYEVHVRDFTIDSSSGVSAGNNGKYLGMVETGTNINGVKTGIDHLKELGVTHVQLLPVYDFATCDGLPDSDPCYNWGYDPRNFNIPEDRYSAVPTNYEERAREFKTMVNEFHKAGIRVIMDVVYNHTYDDEMFENISGQYYTATDLSGTGNSINADVPMVSRMIQDSLAYWVDEYGIDGFRFDLIGIFSYQEVEKWGRHLNDNFADRKLLIYGEPWNGYATDPLEGQRVRYGTTHHMADEHIGVFNGAYRESLKGSNDDTRTGYMFNNVDAAESGWAIYDGFQGSPYNPNDGRNSTWFRNYAADPEQSINYISAHDNFGLWDKVYLSTSSNVQQNSSHQVISFNPPSDLTYPKRVVNFGMGMILTSQGIPFVHAGDEFLRTKTNNQQISNPSAWNYGAHGGTHNTYNAPDSFNAIRWSNKADNLATFNYFQQLIELRRKHAGLRMNTSQEIAQYLNVSRPDQFGGQVITGHITDPSDSHNLFIVYNSGNNQTVSLPAGNWTKVADANGAVNTSNLSGNTVVEGTAVTLFTQAK